MATYLPCVVNLLTSRSIWYFHKEIVETINNKIELNIDGEAQKNYYIIYGNRALRQERASSSLIDISFFSELVLNIEVLKKTRFDTSIFIQLFDENSLVSSTEYDCYSEINCISFLKGHSNIKFIKILIKIKALENRVSFIIKKLDFVVNRYAKQPLFIDKTQKTLIPNIVHQNLAIEDGERTYSQVINQLEFNFYLNYKENKKLLVMLPGTTNRAKGVYHFQRYTWSSNFDCSLMIFLDPTVTEDNNLSIGWFQGNLDYYALLGVIDIIKRFIKDKNIDESNVYLFGSSGGGFSSLQLSNFFPSSIAIVINPQIALKKFNKKEYENLIDYSFFGVSIDEVDRLYSDRLSVNIDFSLRRKPIYYYQNIEDKHHVENHLRPFLETLNSNIYQIVEEGEMLEKDKKLYILLFNDAKIGHTPPNKSKSLDMINNVLENKFNKGIIWLYSGEKIMETINRYLLFNQNNWKFNTQEYIKGTNFYEDGIRVELNDKIGSFYLISESKYINAMPTNRFNISELNKILISSNISTIDIDLKFYILEFSDKEKILTKVYNFKDGKNEIEHTFNRDSLYIKIAFRAESSASYSRFTIESLNIDLKLIDKRVSIPSINHKRDSLSFDIGESTYSIVEDGTEFNFYLNYKYGKKLLIGLPGAIDRAKRVYNFQRYSWSRDVDYSFMSVLDPTIHEKNSLDIGWFQGRYDNYPLPKFASLLTKLLIKNSIKEEDVLFFGSSAGGFVALQLSNFFPLSKVLVINPQIYIDRYYKSKFNQLADYAYKGMSHSNIRAKFNNRISVDIDFSKRVESVYYYQNDEDKHHLIHHLKPYLETLDEDIVEQVAIDEKLNSDKKIHIIAYSDLSKRHAPPNKDETLEIIDNIFKHATNRR
jgi:predicted esterase YcpF (UPF0227 family)